MKKNLFTSLALLSAIGSNALGQQLQFNELMQSNIDCMMVKHDFPDSWVELYNPTDNSIKLSSAYYLSNTEDFADRQKITGTVPAHGYLTLYCDKVSIPFRLDSEGGVLCLFDAKGQLIDRLSYPAMPAANIAYGRENEGSDTWGWELLATPGKKNNGQLSDLLLPDPVFSQNGGVLSTPTTVTITMPEGDYPADTRLYVTTDGQEPTQASPSGTAFTFDIQSSTVLRAKLISGSALCRRSLTHSYIFHPRPTQLPIISLTTADDYLYSDKEGILSSALTSNKANYTYDWRRPANAEYFLPDQSEAVFNQVCEVAVGGNASRKKAQKSIKFYANKRFGTKRFYAPFWEEKPQVTKVKSFMMRNGGQNCFYARINDAVLQRIFGTHLPNLDYQEYTPAILYINGQYYGEMGLRERSNDDYVESNYNGLEDIYFGTFLSYMASKPERQSNMFHVVYDAYNRSDATYQDIARHIDVDNFMKSLIVEVFSTNPDFPANNVAMWRPMAEGGLWRWIIKDLDHFAMNDNTPVGYNMFKYLTGRVSEGDIEWRHVIREGNAETCVLYEKMLSFPEFYNPMIDAFAVYLGDFLKPSLTCQMVSDFEAEIVDEVAATFQLYDGDMEFHQYMVQKLSSYFRQRPAIVYQQISEFFDAGPYIPMTVFPDHAPACINGIALTTDHFDGAYYTQRELRLSSGRDNIGWQMTTYRQVNGKMIANGDAQTWCQPDISLRLEDYAPCDSVSFQAYAFADNAFDSRLQELAIQADQCRDWSQESVIALPEPTYAYANLTGIEALPSSKYDNLHAWIDFYDNNGNFMRKRVILNRQGSAEPKKNLSIGFCEDEWVGEETPNLTFGNWVPQDEFHLKGFYEDGLRGTAEVAYQLYAQITERDKCYPQAFPVSLYVNGDFYGIMAWQLKKHRANMDLDKKTASHVWLDGTLNDKQLFQGTVNWTKFEVRNPKDLYNMDGTDYDGDYPQEIIDATSPAYTGKAKMERCAEAKEHILQLSQYCLDLSQREEAGATASEMRAAIEACFDVPELINYMVFSLVSNNYDGFSKNWQWFTRDGERWTVAPYDCNLTFGYNEDGTQLWPAGQSSNKYDYRMSNADLSGPMRWIRTYYWDRVCARYADLRASGVLSVENICKLWDTWHDRIGNTNYAMEWNAWPESPIQLGVAESGSRFKEWITERLDLDDIYLGYKTQEATYDLVLSRAEWATLCVPFAFDVPHSLNIYKVEDIATDGSTLVLEPVASPEANKPYLVQGPAGLYPLSGQLVVSSPSERGYLSEGLLSGTLTDTFAPQNAYVLQDQAAGLGFYRVGSDQTIPLSAYHAYLTTLQAMHSRILLPQEPSHIRTLVHPADGPSVTFNAYGIPVTESGYSGISITYGSKKLSTQNTTK